MSNFTNTRQSYLSVRPIDYSLTDGTNITPPSPQKQSPIEAEPPIANGGPLTSHPTTPTPPNEQHFPPPAQHPFEGYNTMAEDTRHATPTSPSSAANASAPYASSTSPRDSTRKPSSGGVRKLFSLTNLRSSFSSSRTSLAPSQHPRGSNDTTSPRHQNGSSNGYTSGTLKRPSSPSMASTAGGSELGVPPSQLRHKKSGGNWFRRKSGFFGANGELDTVEERREGSRPASKVLKGSEMNAVGVAEEEREREPAPLLPDLKEFGVGGGDGGLGWDDTVFKRT